jgi:hypothetical protein
MTHTITIEGLTEEEFARITDLLRNKDDGAQYAELNKKLKDSQQAIGILWRSLCQGAPIGELHKDEIIRTIMGLEQHFNQ